MPRRTGYLNWTAADRKWHGAAEARETLKGAASEHLSEASNEEGVALGRRLSDSEQSVCWGEGSRE